MKKLLLLMAIILGCGFGPKELKDIVSYEYSYRACMMHPLYTYRVERNNDGRQTLVWTKLDGVEHTVLLEEDVLGEIDRLAREHKLSRMKENYYPHMDIRDGYSWTIRIRYGNGRIYADGQNAYPRQKQRDGIKAINDYLEGFLPKKED